MAAWVIPAVMAGVSLLQGAASSRQARQYADAARAWGEYNAAQARKYADFNARSILAVADLNSQMVGLEASMNSTITTEIAKYNAAIRVQAAEYNAQLLEKEAELVWQQQELDQMIWQRESERTMKQTRAKFGSAGIEVNVGSPVDYMVDQATQAKLESFVIRHNADIQMGKLLDAAALGRWEGEQEAAALIYQAQLENLSLTTTASMQMNAINVQGAYDAIMARYSGEMQANEILFNAEWQASEYRAAATNSLLGGLFSGASWASRSYAYYNTYDKTE